MPALQDARPSLSVVGALHVDEVATVEGTVVHAASNPVNWQRYAGGVASNVARAAQQVYARHAPDSAVNFYTALGDDASGQSLAASMTTLGLKVHAQYLEHRATGRYSVVLDQRGDLVLGLADVSIAEHLRANTVLPGILEGESDTVFLDANLSADCIETIIEEASVRSISIAMVCVSPVKALRALPHARKINLVFCNRREALALGIESGLLPPDTQAGDVSASTLADLLQQIGFSAYVLTDADRPVLIGEHEQRTEVTVPHVTTSHNVNGAGDALAGATLAATTLGISLHHAVTDYGLPIAADVLKGKHAPLPP